MQDEHKRLIEWLIHESGVSRYRVSKDTGIPQGTLANLAKGRTDISKMGFGNAMKLIDYANKLKGVS